MSPPSNKQQYLNNLVELKDITEKLLDLERAYVQALGNNSDLNNERVETLKTEFLDPIMKKRRQYGVVLGKMLEYSKQLKDKEVDLQNVKNKEKAFLVEQNKNINNSNREIEEKGDLYYRQAQIIRHQNYIYEQSVHLLFLLIFVLIICILVIFTSVLNQLNKYVSYTIIITVISVYILYLVKILFVDKVNINNFNFRRYNYNRPTEDEIEEGNEKDSEFKSLNIDNEGICPGAVDHGEGLQHEKEDKILELVKLNTEPDSEKCLVKV